MAFSSLSAWRDVHTDVSLYVVQWLYAESINDQFVIHPKTGWLLWNYFKRVGARALFAKILSRLAERQRNNKVFGIGIGVVVNSLAKATENDDKVVLFFAPNHNPNSRFIVVNAGFVKELSNDDKFCYGQIAEMPQSLRRFTAWSPYSGFPVDFFAIQSFLEEIAHNIPRSTVKVPATMPMPVDRIEVPIPQLPKPSAVLFGLGNYAKTAILPSIRCDLQLQRVHEIDPDQLRFLNKHGSICLDTSPVPRPGLFFDAWFIAGYHHTHSDLAAHAIRQGATAVIEKPLATTRQQYEEFKSVIGQYPGHRFYLCFHKRYSQLHAFFEQDLGKNKGHPVDMHCIVYEIPLPRHHWYNWPNSGSRLISNGCHWIDYFMYVNDYSEVIDFKKWIPRGSDVIVQVKLKNGSYLSMSLTDSGSQRVGVREYIELRVKDETYSMIDAERYTAENRRRVLRKVRVNPLSAYALMYQKISRDIAQGNKGDSLKSLRSTDLTLLLEEL
jgi:predicted dehydrogenase